ncbi:hypothetical protein QWZ13_13065 [Reinekea marina]|nr:hypothetical protein [Reinekea marina]MDN3649843.1 hypothetical protein [Reinekea marina]
MNVGLQSIVYVITRLLLVGLLIFKPPVCSVQTFKTQLKMY